MNSKIISEELSISWRLKKQIGENVMYWSEALICGAPHIQFITISKRFI
jgi:hypothetical protein